MTIIIKLLKISGTFFIGLSIGLLTACNKSDSTSEQEQLNAIKAEKKNYYFYRSNDAIKAIDLDDPFNPITIEPENTEISGVLGSNVVTPFGSNPTKYYISSGRLIYAKSGQFWMVDNDVITNLAPRRVSSENNAFTICEASLSDGISSPASIRYALPGSSNTCDFFRFAQDPNNNGAWLPVLPDLIYKWFPLDVDSSTPPNPGVSFNIGLHSRSLMFYDIDDNGHGVNIKGILALDDSGNLLWFEGTDFSAPRFTVASGVTTIQTLRSFKGSWNYILVDEQVYAYSAGNNSLGDSLYQKTTEEFIYSVFTSPDSDSFYATDGNLLLKFYKNTPREPQIITNDPLLSVYERRVGLTSSEIFFYAINPDTYSFFSFNIYSGQRSNLFSIPKGPETLSLNSVGLIGQRIYYTDRTTNSSGILSLNGDIIKNLPDTRIVGVIQPSVIETDFYKNVYLILENAYDDTNSSFSAINLETGVITTQLGIKPTVEYEYYDYAREYDGRFIVRLWAPYDFGDYIGNDLELFFADLSQNNSLVQITDGSTFDRRIESHLITPPPPPPGVPPPPPVAPPPALPPPSLPPPPPPLPAGMGGMGTAPPAPPAP